MAGIQARQHRVVVILCPSPDDAEIGVIEQGARGNDLAIPIAYLTPSGIRFELDGVTLEPVPESELDLEQTAKALNCEINQVQRARLNQRVDSATFQDVGRALDTTIKRDYAAKLVTFADMLLAQTDNDQFTVAFQADSSTGKSYDSLEVAVFFPAEEVIKVANASPKSFFYDRSLGDFDPSTHIQHQRLDNKILIFLDAPDYRLLEGLRSFLSHDQPKSREYVVKQVNKNRSGRNQAETVVLHGHSAVIFCSSSFKVDEQEITRTLFVSPETSQEKLEEAMRLIALKERDERAFDDWLLGRPERQWLMQLVRHVRASRIHRIAIDEKVDLYALFKRDHPFLVPKHMRDFPRVCGLIKAHALMNLDYRELNERGDLIATEEDVKAGFDLYDTIREANDVGLSPATFEIYDKAIKPILSSVDATTSRQIKEQYYSIFHRFIDDSRLSVIVSQLEIAGLVQVDRDTRPHQFFAPPDKARRTNPNANLVASGGTLWVSKIDACPR